MGTIIDGKAIAEKDNEVTAARVQNLIKNGHARPKLVVIQAGNDPASSTYVRNKKIACEKVGILCEDIHIDEEKDPAVTETRIIGEIQKANRDDNINGILVQLPLSIISIHSRMLMDSDISMPESFSPRRTQNLSDSFHAPRQGLFIC